MARMIDGDKLVENLRLIATCWSISPFVSKEKHNGAVNMLREVEREVKEAPTLTPPNEWVSVDEKLPEPGERVLATDCGFVGEFYINKRGKWQRYNVNCSELLMALDILYWMPLPAPPDKDNHVPAKAPNEPLTIEQLREMKDEPAYLKVFDPLLKSGWHIIKAVTKDKIIFRGWQTVYVPIDGMGVDYNLYRRPPEGEEET